MPSQILRATSLLGALIMPLLVLVISLLYQEWNRWEMTEKMEHAQLIEVAIPTTSVHWIKKGKELLIEGKLFDIKTVTEKNGYSYFKGLYDEVETAIIAQIRQQMNNEQGAKSARQTLLCYLLLGGISNKPHETLIQYQELASIYQDYQVGRIISPVVERMTPPPQC